MYKDKDKQREANRLAAKRYRAKGMTQSVTIPVIPTHRHTHNVIPKEPMSVIPDTGYQQSYEIQAHVPDDDLMDDFAVPAPIQHYNPMMVGYVPPKEKA